ncbi:hypothetical protein PPYR_13002 [Photinus pyralis]|uniref:O-acyltransferase n=1 Tax=Photinus pyralis TaxID=7054 RepID=A0A5N4A7V1_PHOPY|nr:sterol O-acyltransferase 1-like isoform X1 [Photinus pyralis]KAB0793382.1 hypothetical protein PPYR_13002 [Photinus pyralis]
MILRVNVWKENQNSEEMSLQDDQPKNHTMDERKFPEDEEVRVKVFQSRESVLTELFRNKHILAIYRMFVALIVGTCINTLLHDYFYNEQIGTGYRLIIKVFRNFHAFVIAWIFAFSITLCVYPAFQVWGAVRLHLLSKSNHLLLWDKLWMVIYLLYATTILYCSVWATFRYDFGYALGGATGCETTRLIMKSYAFIRTCAPDIVKHVKVKSSRNFSHYVYFLFAPTLLYRDSYPRSKGSIRWHLVINYFIELIAAIVLCSFVYQTTYISQLEDFGLRPYRLADIGMIVLRNAPYAMLTSLLLFYLLLHLWSNAFAEMLHFSDRLFYQDWWTSTSFERYYRTWNGIVYDWLYKYIYRDFYEVVLPGNKTAAKIVVIFISALFHDYISANAIGFFLPTFVIQFFVLGSIMAQVKFSNRTVGNVVLWYSLAVGASCMYTINGLEYYCRLNYVKENLTVYNFFVPTLFQCDITF